MTHQLGASAPRQGSRLLTPADVSRLPLPDEAASLLKHPSWARAAMAEWGLCGIGCVTGEVVTGYLLVSPALHLPREHPLSLGANADAAALLAVVDDGCGHRLVPALAAKLIGHRTITAIDAAASAEGTALAPTPAWLDASGFQPIDGDPGRYRLELRATRSWLPDLASVWERLRDTVRPARPPEPVGRCEQLGRAASAQPGTNTVAAHNV